MPPVLFFGEPHLYLLVYPLTALEQKFYEFDLTSSFIVDSCIPGRSLKPSNAPANSNWNATGVFFLDANETLLYTFGGFQGGGLRTDALPLYNTTSESWDTVTVPGESLNFGDRDDAMFASSLGSNQGLSFIQGGYPTDIAGYLPYSTPGLITFDASNPANLSWFNSTESSNTPHTLGASMQYVRYGQSGTLIGLGGYAAGGGLVNFDQIMVYDIHSMAWHNVTAGGAIPTPRDQFCTVVSPAPDDSSFNIVMYGGYDFMGNTTYEDVYILSIPSFQWINATSSHTQGSANNVGRYDHTCSIYADRYMVVLGGVVGPGNSSLNSHTCDCSYPATRVFDTSNLTWLQQWNNTLEPYTVPGRVYNVIGGNEKGAATMKQPSGGFNESLAPVFSTIVPRYTRNNLPRNTTNPPASTSHTGAIAGGVIGGLAALALLLTAILFYLRRLRKRRARQQGGIPGIPEWEKAELPHDARAKDYHEVPTDERRHELMGHHEARRDEAVRYEICGAVGDGTVHELDAGRQRGDGL